MTHFDLGTDAYVEQRDLTALQDPWIAGEQVTRSRVSESLPVLPNLGPWAESVELPGLDCTALGRH